jgi:hypothetical protein
MTEPTNTEFGEQFAANKHWIWAAGMRSTSGHRCVVQFRDGQDVLRLEHEVCLHTDDFDDVEEPLVPDTDDHATLGCIEHGLVPAALQDPDACLCFYPHDRSWYVYSPKHDECASSKPTKKEALLAALDEADDIVRRSTEGHPPTQVEDFGDADEFDDRDVSEYDDPYDDDSDRSRAPEYLESPTDPKLCTRPAPAQTVAARSFLETMRQRDADREAQRIAKLRAKETQP